MNSFAVLVQQVASSTLQLKCRASDILLEAKDSSALVVAADQELWLFSLQGVYLASFKNYTEPISSISVVRCMRWIVWKNSQQISSIARNEDPTEPGY